MDMTIILALVRHLLTILGGAMIARGYGSSEDWEAVAGGVLAATAIGFSIYQKKKAKRVASVPSPQPQIDSPPK